MTWRRARHSWVIVTASVFAAVLFVGGAVLADGVVVSRGAESSSLSSSLPAHTPAAAPQSPALQPADLQSSFCSWVLSSQFPVVYQLLGPACEMNQYYYAVTALDRANANITANNMITALGNYENASSAGVANLNATFQELTSYYSNRAEAAVVPYLNQSWSNETYAAILDSSGLTSSIEGLEFAIAAQQFEIWNATAYSWDVAFGSVSQFGSNTEATFQFPGNAHVSGPGYVISSASYIAANGHDFYAGFPWEYWSPLHTYGFENGSYLNLMPGGTIITAASCSGGSSLCTQSEGGFVIDDLTTGGHYIVPSVNWSTFTSSSPTHLPPVISTTDNIGPFDTLRIYCTSNCSTASIESVGAYFTVGMHYWRTHIIGVTENTGVPFETLINGANGAGGLFGSTIETAIVPDYSTYACITEWQAAQCNTSTVYTMGNPVSNGVGPGTVYGENALLGYAQTMESLVNNTMVMAYDYWLTLRALTDDGKYAIPAYCAIPTPSDAFPTATNYQTYSLSSANVEGVYLAYLNAVAREYGQVFTNGFTDFCGDTQLGLTFNWTSSWHLNLNVTASMYFASPNGTPLYANGTVDPNATYADPTTWPIRNVDPTLLYPYEYDWNVAVGNRTPVPIDDPAVGVLVNWSSNIGYGTGSHSPLWGVPTYVGLSGYGNYVEISGNSSGTPSGTSVADGDAVYVSSCVLNGVSLSICPLSVTYFNNFTYGIIHYLQSAQYLTPPSLPGLGGVSDCGFGVLSSWYDSWIGFIGSSVGSAFAYFGNTVKGIPIIGGGLSYVIDGIGCVLAWIVVILLFALFAYVVYRVVVGVYGGTGRIRKAHRENVH